jgi:hypothetical protein
MQNYETNNIINNKLYKPYTKAYFRYGDDTLILFRGSNRKVENVVNYLKKYIKTFNLHSKYKTNT